MIIAILRTLIQKKSWGGGSIELFNRSKSSIERIKLLNLIKTNNIKKYFHNFHLYTRRRKTSALNGTMIHIINCIT